MQTLLTDELQCINQMREMKKERWRTLKRASLLPERTTKTDRLAKFLHKSVSEYRAQSSNQVKRCVLVQM